MEYTEKRTVEEKIKKELLLLFSNVIKNSAQQIRFEMKNEYKSRQHHHLALRTSYEYDDYDPPRDYHG